MTDMPQPSSSLRKILMVDEIDKEALSLKETLERNLFHVTVDLRHDQIVSIVQQEKYDLLIVDLMLPNYIGFKVVRFLQIDPATKTTPLIVLVDYGMNDYIQMAQKLGAQESVAKNLNLNQTMLEVVEKYLKR